MLSPFWLLNGSYELHTSLGVGKGRRRGGQEEGIGEPIIMYQILEHDDDYNSFLRRMMINVK